MSLTARYGYQRALPAATAAAPLASSDVSSPSCDAQRPPAMRIEKTQGQWKLGNGSGGQLIPARLIGAVLCVRAGYDTQTPKARVDVIERDQNRRLPVRAVGVPCASEGGKVTFFSSRPRVQEWHCM